MKIRQVRFDRWGSLSGLFALDEGRLPLLVVDTDREIGHLSSGLRLVLSQTPASGEKAGGLEVELEDEGADRTTRWWRCEGTPETTVGSGQGVLAWEDIARRADVSVLMRWLRCLADTGSEPTCLEDVRDRLQAALAAYVTEGGHTRSVDLELARIDNELGVIAGEAGRLDEERRAVAAAQGRIAQSKRVLEAIEPPLKALLDREVQTRIRHLDARCTAHRKAHEAAKRLSAELAALGDVGTFPTDEETRALVEDLRTWIGEQVGLVELDEAVSETRDALGRVEAGLKRRAWAARVDAGERAHVDELVDRLCTVSSHWGELKAARERELARCPENGRWALEYTALDRRVGTMDAGDRDFVRDALPSSIQTLMSYDGLYNELSAARTKLARVVAFQLRINVVAVLMALTGLALALGFPVLHAHDGDVANVHWFIGGGLFLLFLSVGTWTSAGGLLDGRRRKLESRIQAMLMPLELEGLRLSMLQMRSEDLCRRFGYEAMEDLAGDVRHHADLSAVPEVRSFHTVQNEVDRARAEELLPVFAEAKKLLLSFPATSASDPGQALHHVRSELKTHAVAVSIERILASRLDRQTKARDEIHARQSKLLESVRSRFLAAGVRTDPARDPDGARAQLAVRRDRHLRWVEIHDSELPATVPDLLAADELRAVRRELRQLTRKLSLVTARETDDDARTETPPTTTEGRFSRQLELGQYRVESLKRQIAELGAQARERIAAYHEKTSGLLERRARLRIARDRARRFRDGIAMAIAELESAGEALRGKLARKLDRLAVEPWSRLRPSLEGIRLAPDLSLALPASARLGPSDGEFLHLSVLCALAAHAGPDGAGLPLVLVEPMFGGSPEGLGDLVRLLVDRLDTGPQVMILTRRRSRYEAIRISAPALFKKIQVVEASRLLAERTRRPRQLVRPPLVPAGR